jgi:ADP-ribose pyrophosphatase YjhB (NUDIX family)
LTVKLAAAIVVHDDRVLLVRRSALEGYLPGVWGVPCGKVDVHRGERAREAVLRELREETGLNGEIICFVGWSKFMSDWRGQRTRNVQRNYLVRPLPKPGSKKGDVTNYDNGDGDTSQLVVYLPEDDQEYKWVDWKKISGFGLDQHNLSTISRGLLRWRLARAIRLAGVEGRGHLSRIQRYLNIIPSSLGLKVRRRRRRRPAKNLLKPTH